MASPLYPHMDRQTVRLRGGLHENQLGAGSGGVSDIHNILISARTPAGDGSNVGDVKLGKVGKRAADANGVAQDANQTALMGLAAIVVVAFVISRF